MKRVRTFVLLALTAAASPVALADTPFTLENAVHAAGQRPLRAHNPVTMLEADQIVPNRCVPPAAEASILSHAERFARQQHTLDVARHFVTALQKEDVLLAARESVAETHAAWQRLGGESTPSDLAASAALARAFADYQHALAHRELTLTDLRRALLRLAERVGMEDAPPSQLAHPSTAADAAPITPALSDAHPKLAAVETLKRWWQHASPDDARHRASCLSALEQGATAIRLELTVQLATLTHRIDTLRTHGLPAAAAELAAAEAVLDLARSEADQTLSMYRAMTGTVLAQAAFRVVQHEILLLEMERDHLRQASPN